MRRFGQRAKDSVKGALERVADCFISVKTGDSSSCSRMYTETISRMTEARNGTRQPQVSNDSPSSERVNRITKRLRKSPMVAVVWIQLVYRPRLPGGACSAT